MSRPMMKSRRIPGTPTKLIEQKRFLEMDSEFLQSGAAKPRKLCLSRTVKADVMGWCSCLMVS